METDDTKSSDVFDNDEALRSSPEPSEVIFATSLTAEQLEEAGFKTIVLNHGQAIDVTLPEDHIESTPSTSFGRSTYTIVSPAAFTQTIKKTKYNWDSSVHDLVLPIRCRNISGELHKNRFGSGGRGRCIKVDTNWYTPSEFEAVCGRANSKDWKRSIRYAGRTLQCLIEECLLQPHATSCTCAACCDDETVSGPVRLFTPYKRRKKDELNKECFLEEEKSNSSTEKEAMVVSISQDSSGIQTVSSGPSFVDGLGISHASFIGDDGGSVIVAPVTPSVHNSRNGGSSFNFQEQRHWWQLEEMVKNLSRQAQEIQKQVEAVKSQSLESRELSLQQLRLQMENEKKEALNTSRIEAQMNLSRAILEARSEKENAVQQALQQARVEIQSNLGEVHDVDSSRKLCANCNREAFSDCTGCKSVSYCGSFCQRKDWPSHRNQCGSAISETDILNDEKSP